MNKNAVSLNYPEGKKIINPFSVQWKLLPICTVINPRIEISFTTSDQPGARLIISPSSIKPGQKYFSKISLLKDISNKWHLAAQNHKTDLTTPLNLSSTNPVNFNFSLKYNRSKKTSSLVLSNYSHHPKLTIKDFEFEEEVTISFILPPGDNFITLSKIFIKGDELAIDRRVV